MEWVITCLEQTILFGAIVIACYFISKIKFVCKILNKLF